jgi:hypothetical protein
MTNNTFKQDLMRGIDIEYKVLNIIQKKYPSATLINKFKGYDLWIPELHKSVEVKYDPKSKETGNIVVEIEMFGKPSALMTTKADYWIFYDDIDFVLIEPINIINCIFLNKLSYREFIGEGDRASKKAFLIKKDLLFSYGKKING